MKIINISPQTPPSIRPGILTRAIAPWEYVVDDFLEMACFLTENKRQLLLEELRLQGCAPDAIEVSPSFSTDGRLIAILDGPKIEECWLYYPEEKKIERHLLKKKNKS